MSPKIKSKKFITIFLILLFLITGAFLFQKDSLNQENVSAAVDCVSGGGVTCAATISGMYIINTYTGPGTTTWTVPTGVTSVEYLVVGGGGGGAGGLGGGGGGGGGFLAATGYAVTSGNSYTITVGAGGTGTNGDDLKGGTGGNSVFDTIVAYGGGGGGDINGAGVNGGSGGGSGRDAASAGGGIGSQGYNGGNTPGTSWASGSGGGGAGQAGGNGSVTGSGADAAVGGKGGDGKASLITGPVVYYAGGGGGSTAGGTVAGAGGLGGGGAGGAEIAGSSGTANLGGGGGGGRNGSGGAGGSGIVIIRYIAPYSSSSSVSPNLSCYVTNGTCLGTVIFKAYNYLGDHAEISTQSNYLFKVCCMGTGLSNSCSGNYDTILKLSGATNAHAEKSILSNYSGNNVCLHSDYMSVVCDYATACSSLGSNFVCLASISGDTNAHVGECSTYSTKVCCTLAATVDSCLSKVVSSKSIALKDTDIQLCSGADVTNTSDPCYSVCWKGVGTPDLTSVDWKCSVCHDGSNNHVSCSTLSATTFNWVMPSGYVAPTNYALVSGTLASANPIVRFTAQDDSRVLNLNIDSWGTTCSGQNSGQFFPTWREISPF